VWQRESIVPIGIDWLFYLQKIKYYSMKRKVTVDRGKESQHEVRADTN